MVLETSYIAYDKFIDKNEPNVDCAQRSENKNEDDKKENSSKEKKIRKKK